MGAIEDLIREAERKARRRASGVASVDGNNGDDPASRSAAAAAKIANGAGKPGAYLDNSVTNAEPLGWEQGGQEWLKAQTEYDRGLLEKDRARFDSLYGSAPDSIAAAGDAASANDAAWSGWLNNEYSNLGSLEMPEDRGGYTSAAGSASADPFSIEGQREAALKFRGLTDPTMTAAERAMMEISRSKQERDQRGARTAALSSLRGRGFASGGDEIAALLGAQQETGNRRMLEDLGARGQAVGRSMDALKGYGDITGRIRDQSFGESLGRGKALDATSEFNLSQGAEYDRFITETKQKELQNKFDRSTDLLNTNRDITNDRYKRDVAPEAYQLDLIGKSPGGGSSGASSTLGFTDFLKSIEGSKEADKAAGMLADDSSRGALDDIRRFLGI